MKGAVRAGLLAGAVCAGALLAAPAPTIARARVGCPHRTVAPRYHLTHAVSRKIRRSFLRRHHGYRVLTVVTSALAPQGCVGVYYLRSGGPDGSYRSGGVAYYDHGRAVRRPSRDAVAGMHAAAKMTAVSSGSGTYSFSEGDGVTSFSGRTTFQWLNAYGDAHHPFLIGSLFEGENLAGDGPHDHSSITGVTSYSYTDASDPSQNFSCQVPLSTAGHMYFDWTPFSHRKVMRFLERYDYIDVNENGLPPEMEPSFWRDCQSIAPLDPSPGHDQTDLETRFDWKLSAPSSDSQVVTWTPFAGPVALHHHTQLPDNGTGIPASEQDLSMTGTVRFLLRGVRPD